VHLPLPAAVAEKKVVVLPQCLKGINGAWPQREAAVATGGPADGSVSLPLGIGLPETGGKINLAFGYMLDTPCDEALHSQDASVAAAAAPPPPPPSASSLLP